MTFLSALEFLTLFSTVEHGWNIVQAVKSYQCRQMGLKSGEPDSLLGLPHLDPALNQAVTLNGGETGSGVRKRESTEDLGKDDHERNVNSAAVNSKMRFSYS